jgi:F-type H+-transporting ATPase subunit b
MLVQAKSQAQEILVQAERRASQIIEEAKVAASEEGKRLVIGAKAEIDQEVSRARETLRTQVAALAVAGAEQILRREVDEKAHADLLATVQSQL